MASLSIWLLKQRSLPQILPVCRSSQSTGPTDYLLDIIQMHPAVIEPLINLLLKKPPNLFPGLKSWPCPPCPSHFLPKFIISLPQIIYCYNVFRINLKSFTWPLPTLFQIYILCPHTSPLPHQIFAILQKVSCFVMLFLLPKIPWYFLANISIFPRQQQIAAPHLS